MIACGDIQLLLGPFEDGELRPREMEDVAFHVVGCDACRLALDDYRSLGAAIRGVTAQPALDGFTRAVMARIEHDRPPLRSRLREFWESLGRFGSVIQVAGVAAASAVLTLMVLGPRVKDGLRHSVPIAMATQTRVTQPPTTSGATTRSQVAQNQPAQSQAEPVMASTAPDASGESDEADAVAARDSQELVSALGGGSGPSVAVWDEPRTGTTVVWVPDQQP